MPDAARLFYTAYIAAVLLIILPVLRVALAVLPSGRLADRAVRCGSRLIVSLSGCSVRLSGAERLTGRGPVIVVANHSSYIDSLVLMAALPGRWRFVADREVLDWPIVRAAVRKAGHLTFDRGSTEGRLDCLSAMARALDDGDSLLVYPEGRRSRRGGLLPFHLGAFRAAVAAGRPIVPVTLSGTGRICAYDGPWLRRGPIDITVHEPIVPAGASRAEMGRLRDDARARIAATLVSCPSRR